MAPRFAAFALVLLLSGCAAPDPDAPPAPSPAPATTTADAAPPQPIRVEELIDWSATISTTACFTVVTVSGCGASAPPLVDPTNFESSASPTYVHPTNGRTLQSGELTLDWQASSPATSRLRLTVLVQEGCPDRCAGDRLLGQSEGVSPLHLALPASTFGTDDSIVAIIEVGNLTSGFAASAGQDIHLSGPLGFLEAVAMLALPDV